MGAGSIYSLSRLTKESTKNYLRDMFFNVLMRDIVRESNYETEGCKFLQVNFCFVGGGEGTIENLQ